MSAKGASEGAAEAGPSGGRGAERALFAQRLLRHVQFMPEGAEDAGPAGETDAKDPREIPHDDAFRSVEALPAGLDLRGHHRTAHWIRYCTFRDPRAQASWSMGRWRPSCCTAHCREGAPRPVLIGGRRGIKTADHLRCGACTRP